jgi:ATP-dependent helicase HrpB
VRSEYLVVASLLKRESDSEVSLATALNPELFEGLLGALVQEETIVDFDDQRGQLRASRIKRCGAVILRDEPLTTLPNHELKRALLVYLRTPQGGKRIPFSDKARALQNRAIWARRRGPKSIPDISDEALARSEPFWLEDVLPEDGRLSRLTEQAVEQALGGLFTWLQQRELDEVAPQTMTLPSGKARELDYSSGEGPALHATIQELFGVAHTPRVGILQETITLYLLSPARRPMQVTRDLAGFWRGSYQQIRKELRGRYPKHRWPEDPTVL